MANRPLPRLPCPPMGRLIALAIPSGPGYIDAIERIWADGDAIAPLDDRLPAAETERVLDALRPDAVLGPDGDLVSRPGGEPTEAGDALVIATSGTSGHPKAVIHTHASIEASALATASEGICMAGEPTRPAPPRHRRPVPVEPDDRSDILRCRPAPGMVPGAFMALSETPDHRETRRDDTWPFDCA